jgi:hypothetical protein
MAIALRPPIRKGRKSSSSDKGVHVAEEMEARIVATIYACILVLEDEGVNVIKFATNRTDCRHRPRTLGAA